MPSRTPHSNPFADPPSQPIPPPLPPKQSTHKQNPARPQPAPRTSNDLMAAVRDTVTVRSPDHAPRARASRSQTATTQSQTSRPSPGQRSMSSDAPRPTDKKSHKSKKTAGSMHADVIDRLDFTGVGPMFHHDGPFDACAPSRNRQRQKAPMYAWTGVNPEDEQAYREKEGFTGKNISPRAPASQYYEDYSEAPKKKDVDAIAEAWGIHEPEPFEDFSAGGGGERNGDSHAANRGTYSAKREKPRREAAEQPRGKTRLPPPQPIFTGDDPLAGDDAYPPSPNGGANLGRNKSLMQRFRKMRDAPNVPVGGAGAVYPANGNTALTSEAAATRPTHRPQNSFLGRLGKGGREEKSPDSYVHVDDPKSKDLPPPPEENETSSPSADDFGGYFDPQNGGGGLGRKTSLMRKVRGAVNRK